MFLCLSSGYSTLSVNDRRTPEEVGSIPLTIVPVAIPWLNLSRLHSIFIYTLPVNSFQLLIKYLLIIHFLSNPSYQMSQ
jgi:hypothetical protein